MLRNAQIQAAARWWSDHLRRHVTFSGLSDEERTDPRNLDYQLAERMMAFARPTYTAEQADAFERELTSVLAANRDAVQSLAVDYTPPPLFVWLLRRAGIEDLAIDFALPWKTLMTFNDGGVQVSAGYGAPFVELDVRREIP